MRRMKAVALKYTAEDAAPKIVASGAGFVAERIIRAAKDAGIPSYRDPDVVYALNRLNIGDEIPPELYVVVAQILIFVRDMDERGSGGKRPPPARALDKPLRNAVAQHGQRPPFHA